MRQIILFLLLCTALLTPATLRAEEPNPLMSNEAEVTLLIPDEDDIIHQTLSTSSPYYYTNLMLKYLNGTTPLTNLEYHYLYYGFTYQEDYRPFTENTALDRMLLIISGINPDQPTVMQLEALIENGIAALEVDPFNPKVLNIMAYAYGTWKVSPSSLPLTHTFQLNSRRVDASLTITAKGIFTLATPRFS